MINRKGLALILGLGIGILPNIVSGGWLDYEANERTAIYFRRVKLPMPRA